MIEGIVGRHGVPGRNESGERLLEMYAEQELVVGNSWFKKNDVYKYTWTVYKYTRLLAVKVWRGEGRGDFLTIFWWKLG